MKSIAALNSPTITDRGAMNIRAEIVKIEAEMREWRHHLHANPETAFEEVNTSEFVAEKLEGFGLKVTRGLAKTGVVGTLERGSSDAVSSIALRADMDALDIREANGFAYCSRNEGKMHACGHDGHMAMLLGAAKVLSGSCSFRGTVHFIFQPAEENEGGGGVMVREGLFEKFPVKAVFGMHNFPTIPFGQFAIRTGPMMAAYDIFEILLKGQGGHAAMPHLTRDPIVAAASLITQLQSVVSRSAKPVESAVLSVTQMHGGSSYNIIPEEVVLKGTTRHFLPEVQEMVEKRLREVTEGISLAYGIKADINYERRYPALVNSETETLQAVENARNLVGADRVNTALEQIMGSEDFAFMTQQVPGAYIGIGSGSEQHTANLHNDRFDFNDAVLPLGASYWVSLVETLLPE